MRYTMRGTPPPFVEDAEVYPGRIVRHEDIEEYVDEELATVEGDTSQLYEGMLQWRGTKGFVDPALPSPYSTQFWRPTSFLLRYDDNYKAGKSVFWESGTKRHIVWVGEAPPPERIEAGELCRVSLSRNNEQFPECWLQLSGVY
jgi:hypothetical protein